MKLTKVQGIPNFFLDSTSGIYYIRKMINGRQVWRTTGHTAYKSALRRYHELMTELASERSGWNKKVIPLLNEWWVRYKEAKVKSELTWIREQGIMDNHMFPEFGRLALDEVTTNQVERFLKRRKAQGASAGTISREQSLLHAVFEAAVESDILIKNPLRHIPKTRYTTRTQVLSHEDQAKLQRHLTPALERWLLFMLGTGLRVAEGKMLKPSTDISFESRMLTVRAGKGHRGVGKGRVVPLLDDELITIIHEQLAYNAEPNWRTRRDRTDSLWSQSGDYFRKELISACTRLNIPVISPHVLRHSFATRYLQGGGDIYVLSKILGHASVETTQRHYAHLLGSDLAKLSQHIDLGVKRKGKLLKMVPAG